MSRFNSNNNNNRRPFNPSTGYKPKESPTTGSTFEPRRGDRPRGRAMQVLTDVLVEGKTLEAALAPAFQEYPEHTIWLQEICSGAIRWRGRLELAIDSLALKKKPSGRLRRALLLGAYPLIVQDDVIPATIAHEMVDFVRSMEGDGPAGFVNAMMRRLSEQGMDWRDMPFPEKSSVRDQAQWSSLSEWMFRDLLANEGPEWTAQYAIASLGRPTTWVRAKKGWSEQAENAGIEVRKDEESAGKATDAFEIMQSKGAIPSWSGFTNGQFFVQDISSQRMVAEVSKALRTHGLNTVLDLCSAPGGKAAGLSWDGFEVTATDESSERLKKVSENQERLKLQRFEVVPYSEIEKTERKWDAVWVDAPCTGSGILRRHPEIRWIRKSEDLANLQRIQRELITKARSLVKPGGLVIYSVCSVLKSEGTEQIQRLAPEVKRIHEARLLPMEAPQGDGFYFAIIQ